MKRRGDGSVAPRGSAPLARERVLPRGRARREGRVRGRRRRHLFKVHLTDPKQNVTVPEKPGQSRISAVAVSPTGKCVLTATPAGTVRSWSADLVARPDGEKVEFGGPVAALAATDLDLPVVGFATGGYHVTRPRTEPVHVPTAERVHWVARSALTLAVNAGPGRVLIDGTDLATGDTGDIRAGVFSPDGKTLFTGSRDGVIRGWDVARDARDRGASAAGSGAAVAVSSDGGRVLMVDHHRAAWYNGPGAADLVSGWPRRPPRCRSSMTAPCGASYSTAARCSSATSLAKRVPSACGSRCRTGAAGAAALAPDGSRVAIGDAAGKVTVWSVPERNLLFTVDTGLHRPVRRVAITSDGPGWPHRRRPG